jgi:uncharacterized membrane protein
MTMILKSDKMAKTVLFYVLRSRQHLKILKSDEMAKTVFFTFYEAANT